MNRRKFFGLTAAAPLLPLVAKLPEVRAAAYDHRRWIRSDAAHGLISSISCGSVVDTYVYKDGHVVEYHAGTYTPIYDGSERR